MRRSLTLTALGLLAAPMALANGYQNLHQSAVGLGTAYAANGAGIDDISAIYSNPASILRFDGLNATAGATIILPVDTFENLSSTTTAGAPVTDGTPLVPEQFLDTSFSGYWYVTYELSPKINVGLSFNAPWATESDYTDTAASRYTATQTALTAYTLSPMIGYQVNDRVSIGAALNLQYYVSGFSTMLPLDSSAPDVATDIEADFSGSDFEAGFTLGVEWQATDKWRFGASYRSAMHHDFKGDVSLTGPAASLAAAAGAGISRLGSVAYSINTPWMLQLGAHGQLTDRLEFYGSATLTGWSKFDDTVLETSNGLGTLVVKNGWEDAWYIAAGLGYQLTDKTKIFGGVAYDQTPTQDEIRNPRAPNADRVYVGLGLSHELHEGKTLKLAYSHTFFEDASISLTEATNPGRGSLNGDIKIDADIVMLQYVHAF